MESMEKKMNKAELLRATVNQILEHKNMNYGERGNETEEEEFRDKEESKMLSQLESAAEDAHTTRSTKCSCGAKRLADPEERGAEAIARELRTVKKQNLITHCLLVGLIIVTGAWQISEVSLLLSVKEKLCNPLRAVGNLLRNSIKGRWKNLQIKGPPLPPIEVPQVPGVNLLPLPLDDKEH